MKDRTTNHGTIKAMRSFWCCFMNDKTITRLNEVCWCCYAWWNLVLTQWSHFAVLHGWSHILTCWCLAGALSLTKFFLGFCIYMRMFDWLLSLCWDVLVPFLDRETGLDDLTCKGSPAWESTFHVNVLCPPAVLFWTQHVQEISFGEWPAMLLSLFTWLILPVVICLSQRLSHACLSINFNMVKLRMAH